ncbi:MAG: CpsD/CapB family tyrosine-protein kinase [Betaproteobacteria bacterium]
MLLTRLRPLALALIVSLAAGWALTQLSRPQYAFDATGVVVSRNGALYMPLAALAGLGLGAAFVLRRERRRRPVRGERDLAALVEPLLAARPAEATALRELCRQLLQHWFTGGRALLPVVGAVPGQGKTRLAAELAALFAASGVRTLLVDADLRAPGQHREFRIENRRGLADFLDDREVQPAVCGENLAVLTGGAATGDPLELLSRPRLREFLAAAGRRFRVILVDTPAAAAGPDLEMFAALAGGALVVHRRGADQAELQGLKKDLDKARARVVSVLFTV